MRKPRTRISPKRSESPRLVLWGLESEDVKFVLSAISNAEIVSLPSEAKTSSVLLELQARRRTLLLCSVEHAVPLLRTFRVGGSAESEKEHPKETESLTKRDYEVLTMLQAGLTNKEIAQQLAVSERTVKSYLTRLFTIFDVTNRTELLGLAVDLGLLRPREHS
jgi:DNA-binding NarL/FixJ family response regulator